MIGRLLARAAAPRSTELLPCPFCGARGRVRETFGKLVAECPTEGCIGPSTWLHYQGTDLAAVARLWNRRPPPAAQHGWIASATPAAVPPDAGPAPSGSRGPPPNTGSGVQPAAAPRPPRPEETAAAARPEEGWTPRHRESEQRRAQLLAAARALEIAVRDSPPDRVVLPALLQAGILLGYRPHPGEGRWYSPKGSGSPAERQPGRPMLIVGSERQGLHFLPWLTSLDAVLDEWRDQALPPPLFVPTRPGLALAALLRAMADATWPPDLPRRAESKES